MTFGHSFGTGEKQGVNPFRLPPNGRDSVPSGHFLRHICDCMRGGELSRNLLGWFGVNPSAETRKLGTGYHSLTIRGQQASPRPILEAVGEAEAGSAGEQPAKE